MASASWPAPLPKGLLQLRGEVVLPDDSSPKIQVLLDAHLVGIICDFLPTPDAERLSASATWLLPQARRSVKRLLISRRPTKRDPTARDAAVFIALRRFISARLAFLVSRGLLYLRQPSKKQHEEEIRGKTALFRLVAAHGNLGELEVARFRGGTLNAPVADLAPLAAALERGYLPRLHTLRLSGVLMANPELDRAMDALTAGGCRGIRHLDLSCNYLNDKAIPAIARAMQAGALPCLETLDLTNNSLRGKGTDDLLPALRDGGCRKLRELRLGMTGLGDPNAARLGESLAAGNCRKLTCLDVRVNRVKAAGFEAIFAAISGGHVPNLRRLNLEYNNLEGTGAAGFANAIRSGHLAGLEALNITYSLLTTEPEDRIKVKCSERTWIGYESLSPDGLMHAESRLCQRQIHDVIIYAPSM
jgi:hypothetical protein